jgi:UDP-N-acetylglucosamine transferase subunit ALG13
MFPFDRLVRAIDEIAPFFAGEEFVAQIGDSKYRPKNMSHWPMLSMKALAGNISNSRLVVAHAGMGSVITALGAQKPIVLLPRRQKLGEHTTDHQVATAKWLAEKKGVHVAMCESELKRTIENALSSLTMIDALSPHAQPELIERVRAFISR